MKLSNIPNLFEGGRRLGHNITGGSRLCWSASARGLIALAGLVVAGAALPAAVLWLSRRLVDGIMSGPSAAVELLPVVAGMGLLTACERWIAAIRSHRQEVFSERVRVEAEFRFLRRASAVDLGHVDQPDWHDRVARASRDVSWRSSQVTYTCIGLAGSLLTLVGMLGLLLSIRPLLVVLALLSVVPEFVLMRRVNRRLYRFWFDMTPQDRERHYIHNLLSEPRWVKELRAFELGDHLLGRWRRLAEGQIGLLGRLYAGADLTALIAALLGGVALAAVYAVMAAPSGHPLSAGELTATIGATAAIAGQVGLISSSLLTLDQHGQFLNDYFSFLKIPALVGSPARPVPIAPMARTRLEFCGVSFQYPGASEPALRRLDLTIEPGQLVALVGLNGAGKTTLVKLLLRLYDPQEGCVRLDGVDLRQLDPVELRKRIGVLFQDYATYELKVRDNVRFGHVERREDEAAMLDSLKAAEAGPLVSGLQSGLDAIVGRLFEGGHDLSTGEWQRLALARLLYRDADFWVLDEPTASLDAEAEAAIFGQLRRQLGGRSGMVISHRFSTVRSADVIVVMEHGLVVERGRHDDLVAAGGRYARLFALQAAGYR